MNRNDVRTYLASTIVVQKNVTKHFEQGVGAPSRRLRRGTSW